MPEEKEGKRDFVVKDRRVFAKENLDAEPKEEKETPPAEKEKEAKADETGKEPAAETQEPPLQFPEINFATFVASLNASVLLHLGAIEDPSSGTKNKDLPMAKQTIDILSMLPKYPPSAFSRRDGTNIDDRRTGHFSQSAETFRHHLDINGCGFRFRGHQGG